MADTTFVNGVTLTDADWFNDLNRLHYTILGDPDDAADVRTSLGLGALATLNTAPWPAGHLYGCTISNNGSDATNDIDIAAGYCRDSTNAANITVSAMTKQLDANWAAGTNQGMRYSGAAIADTTYGIWVGTTADGSARDVYAYPNSGAPSAATVLAAWQADGASSITGVRRIGCIIRSGGAILPFKQDGDLFELLTRVQDINASNPGTSAVSRTLASIPLGVNVQARLQAMVKNGGSGGNVACLLTALDTTDSTPVNGSLSDCGQVQAVASAVAYWSILKDVRTNTSAQIRSRFSFSDASCSLIIYTQGWIDTRGRDAA